MGQESRTAIKNIQVALEEIPTILEEIRQQNYTFALKRIPEVLQNLADLCETLEGDLQEELKEILTRILQAQEHKDYVLMADFYECLLNPFLEGLQEALLLSKKEEKEEDHKQQYIEGKKRLQGIDLELASRLSELPEKHLWRQKGYEIEQTSSGAYTLSVKLEEVPYYLHSNINPVWESKKLAAYWYEVEKRDYIIYGLGLGYPMLALADLDSGIQIQIYESDLTIIEIALAYGCLSRLLEENRVRLIYDPYGEKLRKELRKGKGAFLPFYPSVMIVRDDAFREWLELRFIQYQSMKNQLLQLQQNFRENRRLDCASIQKRKEEGKRFFVISAGPSLDDNYLELKQKKDEDVFLATAPVLRKLLQVGIRPDYVVISESSQKQKELLNGIESIEIPLLFLSTASWKYVQNYPGEKYILCQRGFEPAEKLAEKKGWPLLEAGGSVAIIALSAALELGAKEIIFVGQDLAYSKNKRHAEGTSGTEMSAESGFCYQRKDIDGNIVLVPRNLELFRIRLEELVAKNPQVRFRNATEGGVAIKGVPNVRLKELF